MENEVKNPVVEEKPNLWFEWKPADPLVLSPLPESQSIPTPQDNRARIEEQAKQISELTALVQSCIAENASLRQQLNQ